MQRTAHHCLRSRVPCSSPPLLSQQLHQPSRSSRPSNLLSSRPSPTSLPPPHQSNHPFSTTAPLPGPKPLPPRPPILDSEITESFLKGTGPGGQKINKTNSSVQLKHLPTGIVVKCQETRSRAQNRNIARRLLQDRIEELQLGDKARTVVKREREARKKERGKRRSRAKYRALEGEKPGGPGKGEGEEELVGGQKRRDVDGEVVVDRKKEEADGVKSLEARQRSDGGVSEVDAAQGRRGGEQAAVGASSKDGGGETRQEEKHEAMHGRFKGDAG